MSVTNQPLIQKADNIHNVTGFSENCRTPLTEHPLFCVCMQRWTHIEYGDDGGVVPADYSGNVLSLGDFGGDQLKVKEMGNNADLERCKEMGGTERLETWGSLQNILMAV